METSRAPGYPARPQLTIDFDQLTADLGAPIWRPIDEDIITWEVGSSSEHRVDSVALVTAAPAGTRRDVRSHRGPLGLKAVEWLVGKVCRINKLDSARIFPPNLPDDVVPVEAAFGDALVEGIAIRWAPVTVNMFRHGGIRLYIASPADLGERILLTQALGTHHP